MTTSRRKTYAQTFLLALILNLLLPFAQPRANATDFIDLLGLRKKGFGVPEATISCDSKLYKWNLVISGNEFLDKFPDLDSYTKSILKEKGAFGSTLAVGCDLNEVGMTTGDRFVKATPKLFGVETAVRAAQAKASKFKELADLIGGRSKSFANQVYQTDPDVSGYAMGDATLKFKTAVALGGSSVRSDRFNDIDFEMSVIAEINQGQSAPPFQFSYAYADFFTKHIEHLIAHGLYFSEFKAGEYGQSLPVGTYTGEKGKGIKWSLDEVRSGSKTILDSRGQKHRITFVDALKQEARIKVDFLLPVPVFPKYKKTGLKNHVLEVTIVYFLGSKINNNSPTLKLGQFEHFPEIGASGGHVIQENRASVLPLRSTVLFFHPEDLKLARDLSITAPSPDGYLLNIMSVAHIQNMLKGHESYKAIKRLFTRLLYWNDAKSFSLAEEAKSDKKFNFNDLYKEMKSIVELKEIELAERLRLDFENRSKLATLQKPAVFAGMQEVLKRFYPEIRLGSAWAEQSELIKDWIDETVRKKINRSPMLVQYLDFIKSLDYSNEMVSRRNSKVFISFKVPDALRSKIGEKIREWKSGSNFNYNLIEWENPQDLHMTLSYLGEFPKSKAEDIKRLMSEFYANIGEIKLTSPNYKIMGKEGNLLAIQFDVNSFSDKQKKILFNFKRDLEKLGLKPDQFIEEFLPHISIARLDKTNKTPMGVSDVNDFLSHETLKDRLPEAIFTGELEFLETINDVDSENSDQSYREFDLDVDSD